MPMKRKTHKFTGDEVVEIFGAVAASALVLT